MKNTIKKLLSSALAVTMVVPALAQALSFLPISHAAVLWDDVLDDNEVADAVGKFIDQHTNDDGTTLNGMKYFSAGMYDYDMIEYNTAALKAELAAIHAKQSANTTDVLLDSIGNLWNYRLDGMYFWDPAERWNIDYFEAYEDFGGVDLQTGYMSVTAEMQAQNMIEDGELKIDYSGATLIKIPDGDYALYNVRADKVVKATESVTTGNRYGYKLEYSLENGGDWDAKREATEVFTFKWNADDDTYDGDNYNGYYSIQNSEGNFLSIEQAPDGTRKALFVESAESPSTQFRIFAHTDGNGTVVLKAGGDTDSNWFLHDHGAAGVNCFVGMGSGTGGAVKDAGNAFRLYPCDKTDDLFEIANNEGNIKNALKITGLSGRYAMLNVFNGDSRMSGRLVAQGAINDTELPEVTGTSYDRSGQLISEGPTTEWDFIEVDPATYEEAFGTGAYVLAAVQLNDDGEYAKTGYYLAINDNGDLVKSDNGIPHDPTCLVELFRYVVDENGDGYEDSASAILLKQYGTDGTPFLSYNKNNVRGNSDRCRGLFFTSNAINPDGVSEDSVSGLLTSDNSKKTQCAFYLYDISALDRSGSDGVDMKPYFTTALDASSRNPSIVHGGGANDTGIVSGLATAIDNGQIQFKYPNGGMFDADATDGSTGTVYQNVRIPYMPLVAKYGEIPYTTYVFDSDLFGAYFGVGKATGATNIPAYVEGQKAPGKTTKGIWLPFNDGDTGSKAKNDDILNYQYGVVTEIPFTMTTTGTIVEDDESAPAITFTFTGDDDVWVFIDDRLVLDIGGIHGKLSGSLDFKTNTWTVTANNIDDGVPTASAQESSFSGNIFNEGDTQGRINETRADFAKDANGVTKSHTLTIYYVERGSVDSNCSIRFNFPMEDSVTVTKLAERSDKDGYPQLTDEEMSNLDDIDFRFRLIKVEGATESVVPQGTAFALLNKGGHQIGSGVVGEDGIFTLKNNQSARFLLSLDEEVTYYVSELPTVGFSRTDYFYRSEIYGSEEDVVFEINGAEPTDWKPNELYMPSAYRDVTQDADYNSNRDSAKLTAKGEAYETDSLGFICRNFYSLSDVIVIDYGLSVEIDFDELIGWRNSGAALSNPTVMNYHDTDGDRIADAEALYGTINTYPATNAILGGGANTNVEGNENVGNSFVGSLGGNNNNNGTVTFKVHSPEEGQATLRINYAAGSSRSFGVKVNETPIDPVVCPSTGGWTVSGVVTTTVQLTKGDNTIELGGNGGFAPNLKSIEVELPGNVITYQLTEQMSKVDVLRYTVDVTKDGQTTQGVPGIIYIVPATVMHYEEDFKADDSTNWNKNWVDYRNDGDYADWSQQIVADDDQIQDTNIVGGGGNHPYGSDDAYLIEKKMDSNGTSMHVTTNATEPAQFSYTFKGTGTSFFARTGATSGYIKIEVADNSVLDENLQPTVVYTYFRDSQYQDTNDNIVDGAVNGTEENLYGIPLFTWHAEEDSDLGYGEYTVTVTVAKEIKVYAGESGYQYNVYGTEFWLDGIRVFNPLDMSVMQTLAEVAEAAEVGDISALSLVNEYDRLQKATYAYKADSEYDPVIETVRDKLLLDNNSAQQLDNWRTKLDIATTDMNTVAPVGVFTDTVADINNYYDFWLKGPKEEVYLNKDQSVTFYLPAANFGKDGNLFKIYLGIKAPVGEAKVSINGKVIDSENRTGSTTITNATECYFGVTPSIRGAQQIDGEYQGYYKVTVEATEGLIALTNIRIATNNLDNNYSFRIGDTN